MPPLSNGKDLLVCADITSLRRSLSIHDVNNTQNVTFVFHLYVRYLVTRLQLGEEQYLC